MKKNSQAILRKLPAVETILQDPDLQVHVSRFPRKIVINAIQQAIQHTRNHIIAPNTDEMTEDDISSSIKAKAKQTIETSMARHYKKGHKCRRDYPAHRTRTSGPGKRRFRPDTGGAE